MKVLGALVTYLFRVVEIEYLLVAIKRPVQVVHEDGGEAVEELARLRFRSFRQRQQICCCCCRRRCWRLSINISIGSVVRASCITQH